MKNKWTVLICATILSTWTIPTQNAHAEEAGNNATYDTTQQTVTSNSSSEEQTAIVNGEEVKLEAPVKEGQFEAEATQAPKEELQQDQMSRFARSAVRTIPMYRMYNPNSGEHFYTQDTGERDNLRRIGWNYEGIGWQAPTSDDPVYRLYNRYNGEHFYTLNAAERDNITKYGWKYEGIGWYSYTGPNGKSIR
ncbi:hypothetical protein MZM67_000142 [Enterococcus faecium]|nr:hypothetical protein [Enterococcus faecium]